MIKNLHIYPTVFKHDSRILKETKSIVDHTLVNRIIIVGLWAKGMKTYEDIDSKRCLYRLKLLIKNNPGNIWMSALHYFLFLWAVLTRFKKPEVHIINCHSLSVLPIGVLYKWLYRTKLIYDPHELQGHVHSLGGLKQKIALRLEKFCIKYVDEIMATSYSTGKWYDDHYKLKHPVTVTINFPYWEPLENITTNYFREHFKIPKEELIFIYQGIFVPVRGSRVILETFEKLPKNKHLVLMVMGSDVDLAKKYAAVHTNIHYHDPVKPTEIKKYTSSADIGIHQIQNTCLNHYYCMPNKIFEYTLSGIPVITCNFPDMKAYIDKYDFGWTIPPTVDMLCSLILKINKDDIEAKRENIAKHIHNFGWQFEEPKIVTMYERILNHSDFLKQK